MLLTDLEKQFVLGRNIELLSLLSPKEEALYSFVCFMKMFAKLTKTRELMKKM